GGKYLTAFIMGLKDGAIDMPTWAREAEKV
ncbi:MAG: hypothetical protein QOK03_1749, partial [Candidatus Binataceae bacterium]|nr:hypothetical protein [Candidatus Binataceae bacterium]